MAGSSKKPLCSIKALTLEGGVPEPLPCSAVSGGHPAPAHGSLASGDPCPRVRSAAFQVGPRSPQAPAACDPRVLHVADAMMTRSLATQDPGPGSMGDSGALFHGGPTLPCHASPLP